MSFCPTVSYTHLDVYKRQANPKYTEDDLQAMVDVMEYATNKDKTEQRFFVTGVNLSLIHILHRKKSCSAR